MNRKKKSKLYRIYDKIPKVRCKGLCTVTCGELGLSKGEYDELTKITGRKPKIIGDRCNYLDGDRCSVYEDRPSVCRLFGVVDVMKCPHGCEAEKMLTEAEARGILDEVSALFHERKRSFVDNL